MLGLGVVRNQVVVEHKLGLVVALGVALGVALVGPLVGRMGLLGHIQASLGVGASLVVGHILACKPLEERKGLVGHMLVHTFQVQRRVGA